MGELHGERHRLARVDVLPSDFVDSLALGRVPGRVLAGGLHGHQRWQLDGFLGGDPDHPLPRMQPTSADVIADRSLRAGTVTQAGGAACRPSGPWCTAMMLKVTSWRLRLMMQPPSSKKARREQSSSPPGWRTMTLVASRGQTQLSSTVSCLRSACARRACFSSKSAAVLPATMTRPTSVNGVTKCRPNGSLAARTARPSLSCSGSPGMSVRPARSAGRTRVPTRQPGA